MAAQMIEIASAYNFVPEMAENERIAHFLVWMAGKMPFTIIPSNVVTMAINGYKKLPRTAKAIRRAPVRTILRETYKRMLLVVRDEGMRATVNGDDVFNALVCKANRVSDPYLRLKMLTLLRDRIANSKLN